MDKRELSLNVLRECKALDARYDNIKMFVANKDGVERVLGC